MTERLTDAELRELHEASKEDRMTGIVGSDVRRLIAEVRSARSSREETGLPWSLMRECAESMEARPEDPGLQTMARALRRAIASSSPESAPALAPQDAAPAHASGPLIHVPLSALVVTDRYGLSRCRLCGALGRDGRVTHGGRYALHDACPVAAREEAETWWATRPKCGCGRPTTNDGYGLRCLPCQEKVGNCRCSPAPSSPTSVAGVSSGAAPADGAPVVPNDAKRRE